ncbi:aldose 1-epimerase [Inquilinus sp. CAU 1745]|uniref:aldose 1-epimerase n=1 Tax=Inquilinus sp. CAU 1745 TaxID=3140369 RepID=UPI00325B9FA2
MPQASPDIVTLRHGGLTVEICPQIGGAITAFHESGPAGRVDWMRPTPEEAIARRSVLETACFPLVPFSNRIREGRLRFMGKTYSLPLNHPPERHSLHGDGWQNPWRLEEADRTKAVLAFDGPADGYPFPYSARQVMELSEAGLRHTIEVTNRGDGPMPAGIGLHPYFPRREDTVLTAPVDGMWETDGEVMPVRLLVPPPAENDLGRGVRPADARMDNGFSGWTGAARLDWPGENRSLAISAEPPLSMLVVYSPDAPYFCVEPVSHMTDAFNRAEDGERHTGTVVLAPDETLSGSATFTPRLGE